jgi:dTDP-4-dehydrorhamnose reductase
VDWNTLLTRENGIYEPGAFDGRANPPRPTALAHAAGSLAKSGHLDHPVLDRPGWWRRDSRFYTPLDQGGVTRLPGSHRSLLIVGEKGPLTDAFSRIASIRGLDHLRIPRRDLVRVQRAAKTTWAILDLQDSSMGAGEDGASDAIAAFCAQSGIAYVAVSSAEFFTRHLDRPHVESDAASPADVAGRLAASRERRVLELCPDALAIRTGPLFGPWDRDSFAFRLLADLAAGQTDRLSGDIVSPTYLPDLVHVTLDLLIDRDRGIRHLANPGALSWDALARELALRAGLEAGHLPRPEPGRNLALSTERDQLMPPLHSALDRFVADCEPDWHIPEGVFRVAAE